MKAIDNHAVFELNRADFDDLALLRLEPRRLQVEHDVGLLHIDQFRFAQQITFHTEDRLDSRFLCGFCSRRKRLHHAVIGDGERLVTKAFCGLKRSANLRDSVLRGHARVQMQFHTLELAFVLPPNAGHEADAVCVKHQLARHLRFSANALRQDAIAILLGGFKLRHDTRFLLLIVQQQRAIDGVRSVGNRHIQRKTHRVFATFILKRVSFVD